MSIKNIPQTNLIIDSEFLIDKSILEFGRLIPNSIKSINRIYYSLEHTHNQIVKNDITKEEFEKNPKYNYHFYNDEIEGNYSSLNYSEFEADFSFKDWSYDFQIVIIEQILDDLLNSIRTEIFNSKTDIQSKIFFEELLKLIDGSNFFLTEFSQSQNCNEIQKYASESFLEFNSKLFEELNFYYDSMFSDLLKKHTDTKKKDSSEIQNKKLRQSNIYLFAKLFATDFIVTENKLNSILISYNGVEYDNINKLSKVIESKYNLKKGAVQPYLSSSTNGQNNDKNIFKKLKYLQLVVEDLKKENKEVSAFFKRKLDEILNTI